MLKIWGMIIKDHKIIDDAVVEPHENMSEQKQLNDCIEQLCYKFDISKPIFLSKHKNEFKKFRRTVFKPEHFIDPVSFDSFEIESIGEKKSKKRSNIK